MDSPKDQKVDNIMNMIDVLFKNLPYLASIDKELAQELAKIMLNLAKGSIMENFHKMFDVMDKFADLIQASEKDKLH